VSSASIRYEADWFEIRVGVSNLFDRDPPRIDTNEVFGIANTPIGNGYDLNGREFFASTRIKF
jgi:iron complex outermembrane recepter protein